MPLAAEPGPPARLEPCGLETCPTCPTAGSSQKNERKTKQGHHGTPRTANDQGKWGSYGIFIKQHVDVYSNESDPPSKQGMKEEQSKKSKSKTCVAKIVKRETRLISEMLVGKAPCRAALAEAPSRAAAGMRPFRIFRFAQHRMQCFDALHSLAHFVQRPLCMVLCLSPSVLQFFFLGAGCAPFRCCGSRSLWTTVDQNNSYLFWGVSDTSVFPKPLPVQVVPF